jgi:peptidoglycan/LPS O-acetylase OafA/YrhL
MKQKVKYLPFFDGLRALSIILVLGEHNAGPVTAKLSFLFHGWTGVNIFFVISGFLITWLLADEVRTNGKINITDFFIRRVLRLFPAYYAYLIFVLILYGWSALHDIGLAAGYMWTYAYIFKKLHNSHLPLVHTWSLAVEEQFYIIWAFVFFWLNNNRRRPLLAVMTIVLVQVWKVFVWQNTERHQWALPESQRLEIPNAHLQFGFDARIDCLLTGCLLGLFWSNERSHAWSERILKNEWSPVFFGFMVMGAMVTQPVASARLPLWHWTVQMPVMDIAIAGFLLTLLVNPRSRCASILSTQVLVWIGKLSYSIYLWHIVGMRLCELILPQISYGSVPLGMRLAKESVTLAIILLIASVSYYLIERPLLRLKKYFAPNGRQERCILPGGTSENKTFL